VREQSHGGRPSAPAERTPRGEPQGKSAPERGGQERGPRGEPQGKSAPERGGQERGPRGDR
jgi:hypothetical protein